MAEKALFKIKDAEAQAQAIAAVTQTITQAAGGENCAG